MLTELETQSRTAALDAFVAAVWKGQESARLLPLASAAGLSGEEADKLIARVNQAREHLAKVSQLPRLRKDAAEARSRLEKLNDHAESEISRLHREVQQAGFESEDAYKAMCQADDCARQLLALHDEGIRLPVMPREVVRLIERRDAEAKSHTAHMTATVAKDERNHRRDTVEDIEYRLAHMPILPPLDQRHQENLLRDRLKDAKVELAKAESALKKADAAAEAAQKAIPAPL